MLIEPLEFYGDLNIKFKNSVFEDLFYDKNSWFL